MIALSLVFGIYLFSYLALSLSGAYAPAAWGLGRQGMRPKTYQWAPGGFYIPATGEWRLAPRIIYAPLLHADTRYWHSHLYPEAGDPQHPAIYPVFHRQ